MIVVNFRYQYVRVPSKLVMTHQDSYSMIIEDIELEDFIEGTKNIAHPLPFRRLYCGTQSTLYVLSTAELSTASLWTPSPELVTSHVKPCCESSSRACSFR